MTLSNFERMIRMAEEVFDAHHDPHQLQVDEEVIAQLMRLHPASVTELDEGAGPIVWILLIPTTEALMHDFIEGRITEQGLLHQTPVDASYDAIYLCSAMVLPEYRKKGIATTLALEAIKQIREKHLIRYLFVWPFTTEGDNLAHRISEKSGLLLLKKT